MYNGIYLCVLVCAYQYCLVLILRCTAARFEVLDVLREHLNFLRLSHTS